MGLLPGSIIGKLLLIAGLRTNLRLGYPAQVQLILIRLFVIIPLAGPFMVVFILSVGLGQLRKHSNASGPQYGKRFKKEGTLGVYLNMDKGILAFSLNG